MAMSDVPGIEGYMQRAQEQFLKAVDTLQDLAGWTKVQTDEEISLYQRPSEVGLDATKVQFIVDKTLTEVNEYLMDNFAQVLKDSNNKHIEAFDELWAWESAKIYHAKYRPVGVVSARDLIFFAIKLDLGDGGIGLMATSVDGYQPEVQGYVRGECLYFLIHLESLGDRTQFAMTQLIDPKGNLPSWCVNMYVKKVAKFYIKIKRLINSS